MNIFHIKKVQSNNLPSFLFDVYLGTYINLFFFYESQYLLLFSNSTKNRTIMLGGKKVGRYLHVL